MNLYRDVITVVYYVVALNASYRCDNRGLHCGTYDLHCGTYNLQCSI